MLKASVGQGAVKYGSLVVSVVHISKAPVTLRQISVIFPRCLGDLVESGKFEREMTGVRNPLETWLIALFCRPFFIGLCHCMYWHVFWSAFSFS